jgi:4-hydroxybenzoate polyprenyltransferase
MRADASTSWLTRLDYFFLLRPMLFFPGWSTMLAGYYIDTRTSWLPVVQTGESMPVPLLLLTGLAMIMGASFILNQLEDIESDKKNRKLFIIANGLVSKKTAVREAALLTTGGLLIGFFINASVGVLFILFLLLTGLVYNFNPFKLKDKPWGSLIANALMGWLAFAVGWSALYAPDLQLLADSLPYLFFNTSLYLFTLLPDREGDAHSNKVTLAVLKGEKKVINRALVLYFLGLLICAFLNDKQALIFYLLSLPFYGLTLIRKNTESTIRTTKYAILFFALSICLRWPLYFLLMLAGFFITRLYFRYRFDFDYPNFRGK